MMLELIVLAVTFLGYVLWAATRKPKNFPPGPPRLPIVGSIPYLMKSQKPGGKRLILHGLLQNVERYGPVVGFWIGRKPACLIADYDLLREVLSKDSTSGRVNREPFHSIRPGHETMLKRGRQMPPGIVLADGPYWSEQRSFATKSMQKFGFGGKSMEDSILRDVDRFCHMLEKSSVGGKPFPFNRLASIYTFNVLWSILTGEVLSAEDPKLLNFSKVMEEYVRIGRGMNLFMTYMFPKWMMNNWLGWKLTKFDTLKQVNFKIVDEIINPAIEERIKKFKPGVPENLIDDYLTEMGRCTDPTSGFFKDRGMASLRNVLLDLYIAGTGASSNALVWGVLMMMHHPDVQSKVQEEIDRVVGSSVPKLEHKDKLHYTSAVLMEMMRFMFLVPFGPPHVTQEEVKVGGYVLPAGTNIIAGLTAILFDPEHFKEPHVFRPERFLSGEGSFKPDKRMITFSVGKRSCMGRLLAESNIFLFLASMLQKFKFSAPPGKQLPSYLLKDAAHDGLARTAEVVEVVVTKRG